MPRSPSSVPSAPIVAHFPIRKEMSNFTNRHSILGLSPADDDGTGEHGQADEPHRGRSTVARRPPPLLLYPAYGSSLPGSIHTHLCSLRRSTNDAQIRYSHAISSAIAEHQGGMARERSPLPSPVWEAGIAYANEEVAEQMARYREVLHLSAQPHPPLCAWLPR